MAKGKSLNPADAQRKAERKKELKKNKTERQKTRDFALVKKDTTGIEDDIQRLEKAETDGVISASQKTQLSSLRTELTRINKKKEDYVAEHPEHRKLVFRARYRKAEQEADRMEGENKKKERKVFDKNGIPRHPERSIYYDPVMNPFGVPPPGMAYMERPLRPDEEDSQAGDESDQDEGGSDDDIPMPPGPPPTAKPANDAEDDSDDDIPMPKGPPPSTQPPLPPFPSSPPLPLSTAFHPQPPTSHLHPSSSLPLPPPPPPPPAFPPVPPIGFPSFPPAYSLPSPPPSFSIPPPPPGFDRHPAGRTFHLSSSRLQSTASMQYPLTSVPHQTFQCFRTDPATLTHPLPDKPILDVTANQGTSTPGPTQSASSVEMGIVSAPARLRDLKKESTAFLPSSLKRKRAGAGTNSSGKTSASRINAAPEASHGGMIGGADEAEAARPDLLGALRSKLPAQVTRTGTDEPEAKQWRSDPPETKKGKDDYERFMEEIGGILGP